MRRVPTGDGRTPHGRCARCDRWPGRVSSERFAAAGVQPRRWRVTWSHCWRPTISLEISTLDGERSGRQTTHRFKDEIDARTSTVTIYHLAGVRLRTDFGT